LWQLPASQAVALSAESFDSQHPLFVLIVQPSPELPRKIRLRATGYESFKFYYRILSRYLLFAAGCEVDFFLNLRDVSFQGAKQLPYRGLKLVIGVGRSLTIDNVIFISKGHNLQRIYMLKPNLSVTIQNRPSLLRR
jgi:hypothetical protein